MFILWLSKKTSDWRPIFSMSLSIITVSALLKCSVPDGAAIVVAKDPGDRTGRFSLA